MCVFLFETVLGINIFVNKCESHYCFHDVWLYFLLAWLACLRIVPKDMTQIRLLGGGFKVSNMFSMFAPTWGNDPI